MPTLVDHQQTLFDPATMEDVGGEDFDEEEGKGREVGCVVFPGVIKRGDENGERGYLRNVVCKIKVLCTPD
jgi:activating signal cointegrator complex subunit 1